MAHFSLENAIHDATRLDAPLKTGPLMRWQRKALEQGVRSLSISDNQLNISGLSGPRSSKTPLSGKAPRTPLSSCLTPGRSPGRLGRTPSMDSLTPGRAALRAKSPAKMLAKKTHTGKTPKKSISESENVVPPNPSQDRFIPNRSTTNMESGHHRLVRQSALDSDALDLETLETSPGKSGYHKLVSEAMGGSQPESKILSFKTKAPQVKEGYMNNLKVLYSAAPSSAPRAANTRHINQQPERILDAPELIDDYYLNLMSWSNNNHLAVGLDTAVYIWNASDGSISQLMDLGMPDEYVSSVSWIEEGNILGVGTSQGTVQLWDVGQQKLVRTMPGHAARIGSLSWNSYILSSGSRSGSIHHHDVRVAEHKVATLAYHQQEVCGLAWSPDKRHLASGGNDNQLCVWDASLGHQVAPLGTYSHHQAAVKALSWCPWNMTLLASGGGTADRHVRFWNITTGACLQSVNTNSQVSGILWSKEHKEIITGHGFMQNQLTIWKYPSMTRVTDLQGHQSRILCMVLSPDGTTVASAAADETIRLWKCFAMEKQRKCSTSKATKDIKSSSVLMRGIR